MLKIRLARLTMLVLLVGLSGCFAPISSLRGRQQAKRDWERHSAVTRTCGYPVEYLTPDTRFYVCSSGCMIKPGDREYANAYNRVIDRMVERYGIPEWAPCNRYMTETEARDWVLRHAIPVTDYVSRPETSELNRKWASAIQNPGTLICDCPEKKTLLTVEYNLQNSIVEITVCDGHPDWRGHFMNWYRFYHDSELIVLFEK